MENKERVCVTGAGGYVASWLVNLLLSDGYIVHGTLRDPCDQKNAHLKKLENAEENLQLFKADLLDYESLRAAISGCSGVFHVASPVPGRVVPYLEEEFVEPIVRGTRNVLNACKDTQVKRVVLVSTAGAVQVNPDWPKDQAMDEQSWSNKESCKATQNYYRLAKTIAESEALDYGKKNGMSIVTLCPPVVIGPMLQPTLNSSSLLLLTLLKDGHETMEDNAYHVVDVRDVAEALLLTYKIPEAEGRYICSSYVVTMKVLVEIMRNKFPNYNYPGSFSEGKDDVKLSSQKLLSLGFKFRALEDTIVDSVKTFEENGVLLKKIGF
ncbi:hypothetical protein UlMin_033876 [Ulmus minor]